MRHAMKAGQALTMDSLWDWLKPGGIGLGVGGIGMWLLQFVAGRSDASQNGAFKLITALEVRLDKMTERFDDTDKLLHECEEKHAQERLERLRLQAELESKGIIDQKAQQIIAANRQDCKP